MPKSVKREAILLKIETTQGTDAVPTGADDAILVEDPSWSFAGARMVERNPVRSALGRLQAVYAGTLIEVSFKVEIKGSGAAGTAPEIGQALRACGIDETIVASTSVTYAPVSTGHESASIYYYEDGSLYKILGAIGTVSFSLETGAIGYAEFTFTGHYGGLTDAALPSLTFDSTVPPAILGASFSALGYASAINSLSLDVANEVVTPASMSDAEGYGDVLIVDRDPAGSFDPQAELVATEAFVADWKAGTAGAIQTGAIGSTAGNIYALSMPTSHYREIAPGDRDSMRTYDIGFGAHGDDSAFSIAFT
jgi:hypothetical protein